MLCIRNAGPFIVSTDYWGSPHAKLGAVYLSINAGAFRLLVPASRENQLADMKTGREVIVSTGSFDGHEGCELMFEDGSEAPFAMHLTWESVDRRFGPDPTCRPFHVYTEAGLQFTTTARVRAAPWLPWMKPWDDA